MTDTWYEDEPLLRRAVSEGAHRDIVGGLWAEIGQLQYDMLIAQGLKPHHRLLDIGCGCGRAGVLIVPYLDPGNYFGIDRSPALLEAAELEIGKIGGVANLRLTSDFDVQGWPLFDYAIAHSVFTHIPLVRLTECLSALRNSMSPDGRLLATFFIAPPGATEFAHERGGVTTYSDRDPRHVTSVQIEAATPPGWRFEWIGEWGHPRDQMLAAFIHDNGVSKGG